MGFGNSCPHPWIVRYAFYPRLCEQFSSQTCSGLMGFGPTPSPMDTARRNGETPSRYPRLQSTPPILKRSTPRRVFNSQGGTNKRKPRTYQRRTPFKEQQVETSQLLKDLYEVTLLFGLNAAFSVTASHPCTSHPPGLCPGVVLFNNPIKPVYSFKRT